MNFGPSKVGTRPRHMGPFILKLLVRFSCCPSSFVVVRWSLVVIRRGQFTQIEVCETQPTWTKYLTFWLADLMPANNSFVLFLRLADTDPAFIKRAVPLLNLNRRDISPLQQPFSWCGKPQFKQPASKHEQTKHKKSDRSNRFFLSFTIRCQLLVCVLCFIYVGLGG